MPSMLHPGVYVVEVPSGARSIEGSPTSTAIFVGETERGPVEATRISSRIEYERLFGGYFRATAAVASPLEPTRVYLPYAIDGFFQNGGTAAYILRAMDGTHAHAGRGGVTAAAPGVWGNDLSIAFLASTDGDSGRFRIAVVYDPPGGAEADLVEDWDRLSAEPSDETYVVDQLERSRYIRWSATIPPARPEPDKTVSATPNRNDIISAADPLTGGLGGNGTLTSGDYARLLSDGLAHVDDAALLVACPDALLDHATSATDYVDLVNVFTDYAANRPRQDMFFVADLPSQTTAIDATAASASTAGLIHDGSVTASTFTGAFWPHLVVSDPVGVGRNPQIRVPPAGHVAGLIARTDGRRGVWKAPAGTEATLSGTLALQHPLADAHSDLLNPRGVNALRQLPGAGRVVWGSRTLRPDTEWRYISVRRTAIFLRTSIYNGIQWAVFEPNDEPLWASLRATIGAFLDTQFQAGAFAGRTRDQAYFVKADADTTTPADQAAGVVNILVGFAPLRPAEFVLVQLSQLSQAPV